MIIRNISNKVISVGADLLMPDAFMGGFTAGATQAPGLQVLVKMGYLAIEDEGSEQAAAEDAAAASAAVENAASAGNAKKAAGRTSTKSGKTASAE